MIDAHAHLDDPKFGDEPLEVLQRARAAGVQAIVVTGVDLPSSRALLALADEYGALPEALEGGRPALYVCVGFHPHEASKFKPKDLETLRDLAGHPKVVAIGEIGLDYHYNHSPRDIQRETFSRQLTLAQQLGLPVVVHNREADEDVSAILGRWSSQASPEYGGRRFGMLHCFSQGPDAARRYLDLGFCISLACPVTYPNAQTSRDVAATVPLDRLLTETDAPYLPPQSLRGQRNEPANVAAVVAKIAELRGIPVQDAATQTADNARRLFRIP